MEDTVRALGAVLSGRWQTTNCRRTTRCDTGLDKSEPSLTAIPNRCPRDSAGSPVGEEGRTPPPIFFALL